MDAQKTARSIADEPATRRSLLLRLSDSSDSDAWRTFDERYRSLVLQICRSCSIPRLDADDIYQSVLFAFSRAAHSFEYDPSKGRFRGYLTRIVKNEILRRKRRPPSAVVGLGISTDAAEENHDLDEIFEREWRIHHFKLALAAIAPDFAAESMTAFHRLLDGESIEVVARECAMTVDGVRKIKERVRDRLKAKIAEQIRIEDGHGDAS